MPKCLDSFQYYTTWSANVILLPYLKLQNLLSNWDLFYSHVRILLGKIYIYYLVIKESVQIEPIFF